MESNLERATIKQYVWDGNNDGATVVLQLADKTVTALPAGTKVSLLGADDQVLATNTAKNEVSVVRAEAVKYGTSTTFIYNNANYDGATWKTTAGSLAALADAKKVKVEYSLDGKTYSKTVEL